MFCSDGGKRDVRASAITYLQAADRERVATPGRRWIEPLETIDVPAVLPPALESRLPEVTVQIEDFQGLGDGAIEDLKGQRRPVIVKLVPAGKGVGSLSDARVATIRSRMFLLMACALAPACESNPEIEPTFCGEAPCEIALSLVATISDSTALGMLPTRTFYVEKDRRGRYVFAAGTLDRVLVYDSTGQLLETIGRAGAGPEEFRRIAYPLVGPNDSIFVHDYFLGRLTVLNPDLQVSRITPEVLFSPDLVLQDGSFVVARQVPNPDQIGFPLHLMSPTGDILGSFGTELPQHRRDLRWLTTRIVGPGAGGTVWSAPPGEYVLEQWDPRNGRLLQRIVVASEWFVGAPAPHDDPSRPPDPIITKIFERDGLIWVLHRDKDVNWKPPPPSELQVERPVTFESYDAKYDWVLEVVEPRLGQVVARRRFDRTPWLNSRNGLTATLRPIDVSSNPYVTFDVWRLHLSPQEVGR